MNYVELIGSVAGVVLPAGPFRTICSIAVRSSADVGEVVTSEVDDVVWDLVNDANLDVMTRHA